MRQGLYIGWWCFSCVDPRQFPTSFTHHFVKGAKAHVEFVRRLLARLVVTNRIEPGQFADDAFILAAITIINAGR